MYLPIKKTNTTDIEEIYKRKTNDFSRDFIILKEETSECKRKFGFGTISLLLIFSAVVFSFNFFGAPSLGDLILLKFHIKPWSKMDHGFHYTILFSLGISYLSLILSSKHRNQFGAKLSRRISKFYSILLTSIIMVYIYL